MLKVFVGAAALQRLLREAASAMLASRTNRSDLASASTATIQIGATLIGVEFVECELPGPVFVNLHENEATSVAAARHVLEQTRSGRLVVLRSRARRHVTFWTGWRPCVMDPNRVFTDAGLRKTLARYASNTDAARRAVSAFREGFLMHLGIFESSIPIVALHNNSGSVYTVRDYLGTGRHADDAEKVFLGAPKTPEDFILVTTRDWFDRLVQCGRFNVVLQAGGAHDDGSLSIWAREHGRPYANVEALHGRTAAQQDMLAEVARVACGAGG